MRVTVVAWVAFKKLVDGIDGAIGRPFMKADIFLAADALVANKAHGLAFWLTNVGEALNRAYYLLPNWLPCHESRSLIRRLLSPSP